MAAERHLAPRGALEIAVHANGVFESRVEGVFEVGLLRPFIAADDTWYDGRNGERLEAFHDWSAMTNYDHDVRVRLTEWSLAHRAQMTVVHFFVRSKIVELGVRAAGLALRGLLVAHGDVAVFEARKREALARAATSGLRGASDTAPSSRRKP